VSDVNRQCSWDGTGTLATVSANATSSSVITVTGRESVEAGNKFLDVGMVVDIYDSTFATLKASGVAITALTGTTTATLTLSAPVTVVSTDVLIRSGSQGQEIQGILTQLDGGTTTVFNVDRSLYPSFQGNSVNLSGGQLTLDGLQQAYNEARRRGNGKISVLWTDFDTERFYTKLLAADKRYVNTVKGDGGFTKTENSYLEFNGSPVCPDKDSPRRVFMLSEGVIVKYVLSELEWASETGSELIVQTSSDLFEVRLRLFANLFNEFPASCAVLRNYISP
jgi:hypothetical protein